MADTMLFDVERENEAFQYSEIPESEYGESYGIDSTHPRYYVARNSQHPQGDIRTVTKKEQRAYLESIQPNLESLSRTPHSLYSQILLKMKSGRNADKIIKGLAQKVGINTEEGLYQLDRVLKSFADLETLAKCNPSTDMFRKQRVLYLQDENGLIYPEITAEQVSQIAEILGKCNSFEFAKKYSQVSQFYETRPASRQYANALEQKAQQKYNPIRTYKTPVRADLPARKAEQFYPTRYNNLKVKTGVQPETQAKPAKRGWFGLGKLKEYASQAASYLFSA